MEEPGIAYQEMTMKKEDDSRTALVAGASGLTGQYVMKALLRDSTYEKVHVLLRQPMAYDHPKLSQHVFDFKHFSEIAPLFEVDDVFCCLGTTMKAAGSREKFVKVDYTYPIEMARLAIGHGVKRFVVMSSVGANASASNFYLNTKGILEDSLRTFGLPHLIIIRPSILIGDRRQHRPLESLFTLCMRAASVAMVGKLRRYRPILAKHVAWTMVHLAKHCTKDVCICESDELQRIYDEHH